ALAASRRAQQCDDFARADGKGHIAQHFQAAVVMRDAIYPQGGRCRVERDRGVGRHRQLPELWTGMAAPVSARLAYSLSSVMAWKVSIWRRAMVSTRRASPSAKASIMALWSCLISGLVFCTPKPRATR